MKATRIIIHTEPTKYQAQGQGHGFDLGLLKMARHDGKSIPLLLRVELVRLLMEYRDYELGGANPGRFERYIKKSA